LILKCLQKVFFDSIEEEFNLTKHGPFILCDVTETTLNDGSVESNVQFSQQTKAFTFGGDETVSEKKKEEKKEVKKEEVKKVNFVNEDKKVEKNKK